MDKFFPLAFPILFLIIMAIIIPGLYDIPRFHLCESYW